MRKKDRVMPDQRNVPAVRDTSAGIPTTSCGKVLRIRPPGTAYRWERITSVRQAILNGYYNFDETIEKLFAGVSEDLETTMTARRDNQDPTEINEMPISTEESL